MVSIAPASFRRRASGTPRGHLIPSSDRVGAVELRGGRAGGRASYLRGARFVRAVLDTGRAGGLERPATAARRGQAGKLDLTAPRTALGGLSRGREEGDGPPI